MKRYGPEGAVSIFLACVLLTLIVFSCTIVDVSRIHVARLQAQSALQLASQSILAAYDSQLQSQYGIFAKDFSSETSILSDINRYTQSALNPTTISTTSNFFNTPTAPIDSGFSLYTHQLDTMVLTDKQTLVNPDEIKKQILEYMTYRGPFAAVEPFLDKLDMLSKASKTSEIISQKNEIISEIQAIQTGYEDLEMFIDGIELDRVNGGLLPDVYGQPTIYDNYVKKLYTKDIYTPSIYSESEIPLDSFREQLNQNACHMDGIILKYKDAVVNSDQVFSEIINAYQTRLDIQKQIDANSLSYNQTQNDMNAINTKSELSDQDLDALNDLESTFSALEQQATELNQQATTALQNYQNLVTVFNTLDDLMNTDYLTQIQLIIQPLNSPKFVYGLKGIHEAALFSIETISYITPEVEKDIETFKDTLATNEALYVEGTTASIKEELESYEDLLGLNEEGGGEMINNLATMKTTLENNLAVINGLTEEIGTLETSRISLHTYWYNQNKTRLSTDDFNDMLGDLQFSYDEELAYSTTIVGDVTNTLNAIETALDGYSRDLYFDYSGMALAVEESFDYDVFVKSFEGIFPEISLPQLEIKIMEENLPSQLMGVTESEAYEVSQTNDVEAATKYSNTLASMGEALKEDLLKLKDDLYINEYSVGMFKVATDNLIKEEGEEDEALTLSHFPKSDHYMNYEVEYILFGNALDWTNLLQSVGVLLGVRIALNLIALLLDADKMKGIVSLSEAIAGWWSLGIGSIIMTAVLTLTWAVAESVSDVFRLLNGDKIPIIKNSATWETNIFKGLIHVVEEATVEATQEATKESPTKSYLPTLSYKDYMRLFLLSGLVDEDTKCLRILDLIQMNLSKERNEEINLSNYVVGFEASTSVNVNTLFFKLPFMTTEAQNHSAFHFDLKAKTAY